MTYSRDTVNNLTTITCNAESCDNFVMNTEETALGIVKAYWYFSATRVHFCSYACAHADHTCDSGCRDIRKGKNEP